MDQAAHDLRNTAACPPGTRPGDEDSRLGAGAGPARQAYAPERDRASDANASSDEIKRDIDRTRSHLDQTVSQLQEKLTPRHLAEELGSAILTGSGRASQKVLETVREHPLPAAVIGLGLVWLMTDRDGGSRFSKPWSASARGGYDADYRRDRPQRGRGRERDWLSPGAEYYPWSAQRGRDTGEARACDDPRTGQASSGVGSAISGAASSVRSTVTGAAGSVADAASSAYSSARDTLGSARERVGEAGGYVREQASAATHYVRDQASHLTDRASHAAHYLRDHASSSAEYAREQARYAREQAGRQAEQAQRKFWESYEESPLAVGAAALALGVVGGLLIPSTRREDRLVGETRDEFLDQAKTYARDYGHQALEAGQRLADTVVAAGREAVQDARQQIDPCEGVNVGAIADTAKSVVQRVVEAGKEEVRAAAAPITGASAQGSSQHASGQGQSRGQNQDSQGQGQTPGQNKPGAGSKNT